MKESDKARLEKKEWKEMNKASKKIWDYVKRPNLLLTDVSESDRENETKLKNTLQGIIQENFPT